MDFLESLEGLEEQDNRCKYCKRIIYFETTDKSRFATLDHVIPRFKGGADSFDTLKGHNSYEELLVLPRFRILLYEGMNEISDFRI